MRIVTSCGISLYRLTRSLNIRPDITVIDNKNNKCVLIDPAWLFDTCIENKKKKNVKIIVSSCIKLQKFEKWER